MKKWIHKDWWKGITPPKPIIKRTQIKVENIWAPPSKFFTSPGSFELNNFVKRKITLSKYLEENQKLTKDNKNTGIIILLYHFKDEKKNTVAPNPESKALNKSAAICITLFLNQLT